MSTLETVSVAVAIVGGTAGVLALVAGEVRARRTRREDAEDARRLLPLLQREKADRLAAIDDQGWDVLVAKPPGSLVMAPDPMVQQRKRNEIERQYDPEIARLRALTGEDD